MEFVLLKEYWEESASTFSALDFQSIGIRSWVFPGRIELDDLGRRKCASQLICKPPSLDVSIRRSVSFGSRCRIRLGQVSVPRTNFV